MVAIQNVVGFETTFGVIANYLQEGINLANEKYGSLQNCQLDLVAKFECAFYAAKSSIYANEALQQEVDSLNQFFQTVMLLEIDCIKYNRTKLQLIEFAAKRLVISDEVMSKMFFFTAQHLANERLEEDAGETIITMCEYWGAFVIKNFDSFLECKSEVFII